MKKKSSLYPAQLLRRRVMAWAVRLGVNPSQVLIKELHHKWGTCTSGGVVAFADDLAFTGEDFQDFVIVHELLHLRYPDHGKRFQAMMTATVPNWREMEKSTRHSSR